MQKTTLPPTTLQNAFHDLTTLARPRAQNYFTPNYFSWHYNSKTNIWKNIWKKKQQKESLTVWWQVNLLWQLSDIHLKPILDFIKDFGILLIWHKCNGQPLCSKTSCTGNLKQKIKNLWMFETTCVKE